VPLTVVRYRGASTTAQVEVRVESPHDAVNLLRDWQQRYPADSGMVLDADRTPIATSQAGGRRIN
jgi:hypothetical protein